MEPATSEPLQQGDGNQQAPTTETTEVAPEKLASSAFDVINSLQQLGVYICEKYDLDSEEWFKIHEPWSPLTFIKFLLDLHIRCRNDEVGGCAYKYWIGVEQNRVLMKKFLNAVEPTRDENKLRTTKALIAKTDEESYKLRCDLKEAAKKFETDEKRKALMETKYKFKPKFDEDEKEIKKPNTWAWGDVTVRKENLINYKGLEFKEEGEEQRSSRLQDLENEVRSLQHECHALGAALCDSNNLEVDAILKCVDYWSPASFNKALEKVLKRTKTKPDFWFLQRSCGKLRDERETFNRFKMIVVDGREIWSLVDTTNFENKLFEVIKLFFGLAYTDSAALTKNKKIELFD